MRLGVLGDVHAEHEALSAALELFRREGAERVLAVGDFADGAGDLDRTVSLLREAQVEAVAGNHERWILSGQLRTLDDAHRLEALAPETVAWLRALPATRTLATPKGTLLLCHGVGTDDMICLREDDQGYALQSNFELQRLLDEGEVALMVGGHTHQRMVRKIRSLTVVNAGTLKRDDEPCALLLDLAANVARFFDWKAGGWVEGAPIELPR